MLNRHRYFLECNKLENIIIIEEKISEMGKENHSSKKRRIAKQMDRMHTDSPRDGLLYELQSWGRI